MVAVFASGSGTNFENLALNAEKFGYDISLLISDKPASYALTRAEKLNIEALYIDPKPSKADMETRIVDILQTRGIGLIALAGYMRIVGDTLLNAYPDRIINIHPAYLPCFPGKDGIGDAYRAGAEYTGVTVHYVDEGVDTGKIILQQKLPIDPSWTLDELESEVHKLEYELYPRALDMVVQNIKSQNL